MGEYIPEVHNKIYKMADEEVESTSLVFPPLSGTTGRIQILVDHKLVT